MTTPIYPQDERERARQTRELVQALEAAMRGYCRQVKREAVVEVGLQLDVVRPRESKTP